MKYAVVLALFVCLVGVSLAMQECGHRVCPMVYSPFCGMKMDNGKLVKKFFNNYCMMKAADDCEPGWEPCH